MSESVQQKLSRIRPPRVQITYDVETGGAIQKKELPFIVGIMADLSGHRAEQPPKLKDRKFVEIDRDNYDDVMEAIGPRLALRVGNRVGKAEGEVKHVELLFVGRFKLLEHLLGENAVARAACQRAFTGALQLLKCDHSQ